MTVSLKHTFQSAKTDSADPTLIQPSNWNEEHELTLATDKVLGRATAGTGPAEELSIGTALSVSGGTLAVTNVPVANGGTGAATLTANAVLVGNGTSAVSAVAPGTAGNVLTSNGTSWTSVAAPPSGPSLDAVATGSLSNGSTAVINADGTVSVVAGVAQAVGSPTVFESATSTIITSAYDANTQKVVIAYADGGNGDFGTAVVGTVSGTSISFGTPVVFDSTAINKYNSAVYHAAAQKIVIAYADPNSVDQGFAKVGTVSGTSISFGGRTGFELTSAGASWISTTYDATAQKIVVVWQSGGSVGAAKVGTISGTSISFGAQTNFSTSGLNGISATYDANTQKVVVTYYRATTGGARVGTVSGTGISFGTEALFTTATLGAISATYDAGAQKVVIAYRDQSNSNFGTAITGTVSGTSISYGTPVVFESANTFAISAVYDANAQKVVIAYQDVGNSNFGTVITGTITGTSIGFGLPIVFESAITSNITAAYNSVQQKVTIAYSDQGNSNYGTATVFQAQATNFQRFIGFSNAAYTNGQTATIQLVGSIDDAQTGLTSGQSYFVQENGTLSITPSFPSVYAGIAVAANRIIVRG
jgi:hypothetical protein